MLSYPNMTKETDSDDVFLCCHPHCPCCLAYLNSIRWVTWANWAATKGIQPEIGE